MPKNELRLREEMYHDFQDVNNQDYDSFMNKNFFARCDEEDLFNFTDNIHHRHHHNSHRPI